VVVLEVNTRRAGTREARLADLAEALDFTRTHLGASPATGPATTPAAEATGARRLEPRTAGWADQVGQLGAV